MPAGSKTDHQMFWKTDKKASQPLHEACETPEPCFSDVLQQLHSHWASHQPLTTVVVPHTQARRPRWRRWFSFVIFSTSSCP